MRVRRRIDIGEDRSTREHTLLGREWLATNGLGGFASSTLANVPTRRYHGMLVAALPNPLGRMVMLTELSERVRLPDGAVALLGGEHTVDGLSVHAAATLVDFELDLGLPLWHYRIGNVVLEKRVWMPYAQNTVHISYRIIDGPRIRLALRPALSFRALEEPVSTPLRAPYTLDAVDDRLEIALDRSLPPLRLRLAGALHAFVLEPRTFAERLHRLERQRGYDDSGELWSPGYFRAELEPDATATLVASTESWANVLALPPSSALAAEQERREGLIARAPQSCRSGVAAELTLAADAFVVTPAYRAEDVARRHAAGDELRSIIAGYHWFTDWGRDTMIALEGLTLCTGRHREAGEILRTFAQYTRDGLIPNMFPNHSSEGHYNTADASLWFFHAVDRYVRACSDHDTLQRLLPVLRGIADHHLAGTRYGIRIDPADGLLTQGEEGVQLTWMDAKVDGWVVTPRRGKAVELNALWYNALRLLQRWLQESDAGAARDYGAHADRTRESFNRRFWYESGGYLLDTVDGPDGDDTALRPNQLLAIALPHAVLAEERWQSVMHAARAALLTPVGLRSLGPDHPDYHATYDGDLRTRDGAYHQGTVWPWLLGPFLDAWLRTWPDDVATARTFLDGLLAHLDDFGVGSIAEIFDAEPPFTPRGCIAQAWSVAEVLRCLQRTAGITPTTGG